MPWTYPRPARSVSPLPRHSPFSTLLPSTLSGSLYSPSARSTPATRYALQPSHSFSSHWFYLSPPHFLVWFSHSLRLPHCPVFSSILTILPVLTSPHFPLLRLAGSLLPLSLLAPPVFITLPDPGFAGSLSSIAHIIRCIDGFRF